MDRHTLLDNTAPINPNDPVHAKWLKTLQGNILTGHGRDFTIHFFIRFRGPVEPNRRLVNELSSYVTTAQRQEVERIQYKAYGIPGDVFGNMFLTANGYRKLGFSEDELRSAFSDRPDNIGNTASNFIDGMARHCVSDFSDPDPATWEAGFDRGDVDAMLLIADDDEDYLNREARRILNSLDGRCDIARVERGNALRNDDDEGIEHFGFIDGRSQPLFLTTDFTGLAQGQFGSATREKGEGSIDRWNPFAPLKLLLRPDPLSGMKDCYGSFLVFRKLEQDVRGFLMQEQILADKLGLAEADRARVGAMIVGRFRDGTPLALSGTDGFTPAKENNFSFDATDREGVKCPYHAHIRKMNPRGDLQEHFGVAADEELTRRIARRGIAYGKRSRSPGGIQDLSELPSGGVGLLFMCFQSSIRHQFAFIQHAWSNNQNSPVADAGVDSLIGRPFADETPAKPLWPVKYGEKDGKMFTLRNCVKMKGGEYFFAPSSGFFAKLA